MDGFLVLIVGGMFGTVKLFVVGSQHENCVFDMLRFWKYGLYAFLRFAPFKERGSTGEEKASMLLTTFEGRGKVQIKID